MTDESGAARRSDPDAGAPAGSTSEESQASDTIPPDETGMRPRPSQAEGPEQPGTQPAPRPPRPSQAEGERGS